MEREKDDDKEKESTLQGRRIIGERLEEVRSQEEEEREGWC